MASASLSETAFNRILTGYEIVLTAARVYDRMPAYRRIESMNRNMTEYWHPEFSTFFQQIII